MNIKPASAVKHFYSSPSFELIYYEAVANAIDAGATEVSIHIQLKSFNKPDNLQIEIKDNGVGFNDDNYDRFAELLNVNNEAHKGVGRLVYLAYFSDVYIESVYDNKNARNIVFNYDYNGECEKTSLPEYTPNGASLKFVGFKGKRVNRRAFLRPVDIKAMLLNKFLPTLYARKEKEQPLSISISLVLAEDTPDCDFCSDEVMLNLEDLPKLEKCVLKKEDIHFFDDIELFYSIDEPGANSANVISSVSVDGRAMEIKLLPQDAIPAGYQVLLILKSEYFGGKTNMSRQSVDLLELGLELNVKNAILRKVAEIINSKIPIIQKQNASTYKTIERQYPHLIGYYDSTHSVGLVTKNNVVKEAQEAFLLDQKSIFESDYLDDFHFYKALQMASRSLTEYIVYRKKIIEKLRSVGKSGREDAMHNIISPRYKTYKGEELVEDIYNNNVWLLDDKFMTYSVTLSERDMSKLMAYLDDKEYVEDENGRPDISIVFSQNPDTSPKVDVVIVELKKYGIKLAKQEEVISQLRQRARRLIDYYEDKIERMWFFGVVEMTNEFENELKEDDYIPLYSKGKAYYKQIKVNSLTSSRKGCIDVYLVNYESLVEDAEARNQCFFDFLKERIKSYSKKD